MPSCIKAQEFCTPSPHQIQDNRFLWIKVRVSHYQRFRITFVQFIKQLPQRLLLSLRPCVARSLAVNGKTSYICNPNRMAVMVSTMRSSGCPRSMASSVDEQLYYYREISIYFDSSKYVLISVVNLYNDIQANKVKFFC